MKAYIYVLVDPNTLQKRYVGVSLDPQDRLKRHITYCQGRKTHKERWIDNLRQQGQTPLLEVLEEISEWSWELEERKWIAFGRQQGWPLTNETDGGEGAPGRQVSELTRERISLGKRGHKLPPFTDEHRRKISEANKGKQLSEETRQRLSQALKGKDTNTKAWETRRKKYGPGGVGDRVATNDAISRGFKKRKAP